MICAAMLLRLCFENWIPLETFRRLDPIRAHVGPILKHLDPIWAQLGPNGPMFELVTSGPCWARSGPIWLDGLKWRMV
jgi:hypothetical protein